MIQSNTPIIIDGDDASTGSSQSSSQSSNDQSVVNVARALRRMKRKMFLKAIEQPQRPVDSFREMMLKVALEESRSFSDVSNSSLHPIAEE